MHPISEQDGGLFRTLHGAKEAHKSLSGIGLLHFRVIKGSDNKVGLAVMNPDGSVSDIFPYNVITSFLKINI